MIISSNKNFMKSILLVLSITLLLSFSFVNDIYSLPLRAMDGKKIDLHQYKGKKLLFVILPASATDTTISAAELMAFQQKYSGAITTIGIPAEEMGFKKSEAEKVKALFGSIGSSFILSEGMKVKKGAGQPDLFQWLTSKDKNRHFDQDVQGVGSKFFVDETGELYAVMGGQVKLSHPVIDRIVARTVSKTQ